MKLEQIQTVIMEAQADFLGDGLAANAFNRALQAIEGLGTDIDVHSLAQFFEDEQAEALRQANYYESHFQFYHENVAAGRRAEAAVFGVLIAALVG